MSSELETSMPTELEVKLSINSDEDENTEYKVTLLDLFGTIFGLLFYVADICSDVTLAILYFQNDYYLVGVCTVILIYLASVIDTVVSFYIKEFKNLGFRFWLQYISFSLVNVWGVKIIFSLIVSQCRAYKSQRVNTDMYKKVEQKSVRVARLKIIEVMFETLPQIYLQMYVFLNINESRSFRLPFVSECDELQTSADLFNVAGLVLMIKFCYIFMILYVNLYKIWRVRMSRMAAITLIGCISFNGVNRGVSLSVIVFYPYQTVVIILLHVSVGGIYWYRNISKGNQSVYKRWFESIFIGTMWFITPLCSINHKLFLALYIIHIIVCYTKMLQLATQPMLLTNGAIIFFGLLQAVSLVCWIVHYVWYFEETEKLWNQKNLPDNEAENLTI